MTKPEYRIPTMAEVHQILYHGFKVLSTFSGCGGSSLGYRIAGFKVLAAVEFVEAARSTYRKNFPDTYIFPDDMRAIDPSKVLDHLGLNVGELDVLDGSPPCSAFSSAGTREKGWGKVKEYSDTKQRVDDLFFEYARFIKGIQPKVFVAENVSGLIVGKAKGYFRQIYAALKNCGYNVTAKVLNAKNLGVPQSRSRLIFIGTRNDLPIKPSHPIPLPYLYTTKDAIPHIYEKEDLSRFPEQRIDNQKIGEYYDEVPVGKAHIKRFSLKKPHPVKPCPTLLAMDGNVGMSSIVHPYQKRKFTVGELKSICSFPPDFQLSGTYKEQVERLGRAVPPMMMYYIANNIHNNILVNL